MKKLLYEITHATTYEYVGDVAVSQHLLKLTPRSYLKQNCLEHTLEIDPKPGTTSVHRDYFGNATHFIGVETSHQRLVIESRSRVAVSPALLPGEFDTPPWESVRAQCRDDHSGLTLEAHEFTYPSPLVPNSDEIAGYAEATFTSKRPILDAVTELTRRIHEDFTFDSAATKVTTPVLEV